MSLAMRCLPSAESYIFSRRSARWQNSTVPGRAKQGQKPMDDLQLVVVSHSGVDLKRKRRVHLLPVPVRAGRVEAGLCDHWENADATG